MSQINLKKGHRRLSRKDFGNFSIKKDILYWDDEKIHTIAKLGFFTQFGIIISSFVTLLAAIVGILAGLAHIDKNTCFFGVAIECTKQFQSQPQARSK